MRTDAGQFLQGTRLQAFLNEHKSEKGKKYNFTSFAKPFGAYFIPEEKMGEFYSLYIDVLERHGVMPFLTEKPGQFSPIIIDLDFKFALTEEFDRKYDEDLVKCVVSAYFEVLQKYLILDDEAARCYVFERSAPYKNDKNVKDGLHIMFPEITTPADIKLIARDYVMKKCRDLFLSLGTQNSVADIVDLAVIQRNNWFMYGSGKPSLEPYRLTKIYGPNLEKVSFEHSYKDLVPLLSVKGTTAPNIKFRDYMEDVLATDFIEYTERTSGRSNRGTGPRRDDSASNLHKSRKSKFDCCDNLDYVRELVTVLKPTRADEYSTWIQTGWALHNIDHSLLDSWIDFSKQSTKYEDGVCERYWKDMRDEGLGIGSLVRWARQDDDEAYERVRTKDIKQLMEMCVTTNGAHHSLARVMYGMYRYNFVCLSRKFKSWIEYRGHRWYRTEDGYGLLIKISNTLYKEFSAIASEYANKIAEAPEENKQALEMRRVTATKIGTRLLDSNFKANVMKEAYELFYIDGFEEKLDTNCQLISFENGVYDLDKMEFRDGRPEDCVTLTTGIDYEEYDGENPHIKTVERLMAQIHTNPDIRNYIYKLMSSFLSGQIKQQKFHIWTGSGSNAKSFLVDLFMKAFGTYSAVLPIALLTQKRAASNAASPELSRTKGRRFCVLQEPEDDVRINVGLMKELTGGDKIVSRDLFCPIVEFKPQFKMVLTCNRLPEIPSNDGGTWRRIRVVEFMSKFCDDPDPENPLEFPVDLSLSDHLDDLGKALMSILIPFYRKYKTEGLREPAAVMHYTMEYQKRCDVYLEFVNTYIVATEDKNDIIKLSEVYATFKDYYKTYSSEVSKMPNSKELKAYIDTKVAKGSHNMWKGYRLKAVGEEDYESDEN